MPGAVDVVGGGPVGSQGVAQAPMTDTDTEWTAECEVHADAGGAEGRGMDASDDFDFCGRRVTLVPETDGMRSDGPGMAATTGGSDSTDARATALRVGDGMGDKAGASGGEAGTDGIDEGALSAATYIADGTADRETAQDAPANASKRRRRSRSNSGRPKAAHDRRRVAVLECLTPHGMRRGRLRTHSN